MFVRFALGLVLVLTAGATTVSAGPLTLDPEMTGTYTWRVLVQISPHSTLGAATRAQLLRELRAALSPSVGTDLGTVEVIDLNATPKERWEPLWKKFGEVGWDALKDPEFRKLTGVKTHFLTVSVQKDGKYRLECGQHDGSSGLFSPQPRTVELTDLDRLNRYAGLLVGDDFGPVGTVEPLPETKTACLVRLRGGNLPGMDRLVKIGDVFALSVVSQITRPAASVGATKSGSKEMAATEYVAQPQPFTLLRVVSMADKGIAKCEILSPLATPLPDRRGVVGYRARKLSTRDDRLTVRIVDENGKPPAPSVPIEVWAADNGFRDTPTPSDTLSPKGGGFSSGRSLRGVACVYVKLGSTRKPYVLPVLDSAKPLTIEFRFDEGSVLVANFENRCERFLNRAIEARLAQDEMFIALAALIEKARNKEAFDRATNGLKSTTAVYAELTAELTRLREEKLAADGRGKRLLDAAEQWLTNLQSRVPDLEGKISDLKVSVEKANNPAEFEKQFKANELARQIKYHEGRGEVPEALELYDRLHDLTKQEDVKTRKQALETEWKAKSPEQEAARTYLNDEWPRLTTLDEIKGGVQKLKQAVDTLVASRDRLGLLLAKARIQAGYARLNEVVNTLDSELVQDKVLLQDAKTVFDNIRKIEEGADAEVKKLSEKR